ncbi:hypothetical protein [Trichocoleus sp. FACHB-591]|uniref:hypothetical protein n=1 Tax=Trichocoleus sp. FACHB-591 TaxID=2692872 RepID=UPI00351C0AE3
MDGASFIQASLLRTKLRCLDLNNVDFTNAFIDIESVTFDNVKYKVIYAANSIFQQFSE